MQRMTSKKVARVIACRYHYYPGRTRRAIFANGQEKTEAGIRGEEERQRREEGHGEKDQYARKFRGPASDGQRFYERRQVG